MAEEFIEQLSPRTFNTMSEAIALSSPSGRMSKRAKEAATQRLALALFGPKGLQRGEPKQPTEVERLERKIEEFRSLASRGMQPRKFTRLANELEEKLNTLKREALRPTFPPEPQSLINLRKESLAASRLAGDARERAKLGLVSQSEAQKLAEQADKIEVRLLDAERAFERKSKEVPLEPVSLQQAQERFDKQSPHSKALDSARSAQNVAPAEANTDKEKRLQQRWLKNPARLDFQGVDTKTPSVLVTAYRDWLGEKRVFVDFRGTYRIRENGGRPKKAPWSDEVRKQFKTSAEFHRAANKYADAQGLSQAKQGQLGMIPRLRPVGMRRMKGL